MNKVRRKALREIAEQIATLREKYELSESASDSMNEALDSLDEAIGSIESAAE